MSEEGASFLSRWSRRKRAATGDAIRPAVPAIAPPPLPSDAAEPGVAGTPRDEAPAFDPASLPSAESLTAESDFTVFLREEVPTALRRAALRRAWSLDPAIRDFTGPADYAWDFNAPDGGMAGFSPDLPGDVQRLLAQAIGLDTSAAEDAADEEPIPVVEAAIPAPGSAAPDAGPALEAPDDSPAPPDAVPVVPAQAAETTPALPVPPVKVAEDPPARRRHGGALPT